ncbi:hypothetical protein YYC_00667 [Plasmodium yoelii 17X]|uniref:Uncharacterized protein n=4 Tax=Plasmodium yoelii TaxID=5861 RepID=A0AAE9WW07_PLAYO|nr:conserved Plasmodium protein, unknown function [Plasmodium yoelii]ETB63079.1 hypothetical protein YYC_00667 [Plasmodium yoelii 17X]WBY60006.1 hypothetical protein Py17XNL_001303177 [Plasmodium yoelii yoelii]VTZ80696.1 conserved Plasmodium protein, unknown function [Plasmodium yoelii]|eukprot:XP_034493615.1 conserved Plasmodium protein, unknown function [Plasmodium yoelii]
MIKKKNSKSLTHLACIALLVLPNFFIKNLSFDNFMSLSFDKLKKKIYNKTTSNHVLKNSDDDTDHYMNNNISL